MGHPVIHAAPALDLTLERLADAPLDFVWAAWTTPELIIQWFTPGPWKTIDCQIDLRPGGALRTVMLSPEGREFPNAGCILEVETKRRLVWTSALGPGFRPLPPSEVQLPFTAVIEMAPEGAQTRYAATAMHGTLEDRRRHEEMGFHQGWSAALDQLVALSKRHA